MPDSQQRAELQEIVEYYLDDVRFTLDPLGALLLSADDEGTIQDQDVEIEFYGLDGGELGRWRDGNVLLPGEEGPE